MLSVNTAIEPRSHESKTIVMLMSCYFRASNYISVINNNRLQGLIDILFPPHGHSVLCANSSRLDIVCVQYSRGYKSKKAVACLFCFIQDNFRDAVLRFKANKVKLNERIQLHQHKRNVTEENISRELADLNKVLKVCILHSRHTLLINSSWAIFF